MNTIITQGELNGLTDQELGELHQHFLTLLTATSLDRAERRNILATIENIERALGQTAWPRRGPTFSFRP